MKATTRVLLPYLLLGCLVLGSSLPGAGQQGSSSPTTETTTPAGANETTTSPTATPTTTPTTRTETSSATPTTTKTSAPRTNTTTNATEAPNTTSSRAPSPEPANFTFRLVGQRVAQDLWISGAEEVVIVDSVVLGRIDIVDSRDVSLQRLETTGGLGLAKVEDVRMERVAVGGSMTFTDTQRFELQEVTASGDVSCTACANGTYRDVVAGGRLLFDNLTAVDTSGATTVAARAVTSPTFTESPDDVVKLNITDSSVVFRAEKDVDGAAQTTTGEATLDVSTRQAVARLAYTPPDRPQATAVELESRFEKLHEYEDRDGDGAYDLGDLVVREYLIDELPVASVSQERVGGDEPGWQVRVAYALPPGGTFALVYTARDATGEQTKIDVEVDGYQYASATSRLALQIRLASASDWRIEHGAQEDRLVFLGQGYDGFFGWLHTAQADGVETPVTAQVLEEHRDAAGQRELVLFLAYARADRLVHDPSIGVLAAALDIPDLSQPEIGNALVYGSTLVAAVVVLWAMGKSGRRRP